MTIYQWYKKRFGCYIYDSQSSNHYKGTDIESEMVLGLLLFWNLSVPRTEQKTGVNCLLYISFGDLDYNFVSIEI